MTVSIKRVETAAERLQWVVLEGSIEGIPAVSKRVSIAISALVTNPALLDTARTNLIAEVSAMHANYIAIQAIDNG